MNGTAQHIAKIRGVTPGTVAASKVVIVDANKKIDEIDITTLKIGGTAITKTAAELNNVASGTQAAAISDPTGGTTTDTEARAAINDILDALQTFGIIAP